MLSPPLPGTPEATVSVEHTVCDTLESEGPAYVGFPNPFVPPSVGKRSKARVRCPWKDCGHREPDAGKMK